MSKTYLGLDIGTSLMKAAVVKNGRVEQLCSMVLPEDLPKVNGHFQFSEELGMALRSMLQQYNITARNCALVLSSDYSFVRRVTVPRMTASQLKVNLPYEFQDYIQDDPDAYFYDYIMVEDEMTSSTNPDQLDLMVAACPKKVITDCRQMLKKIGLRLTVAVPEYLAYRNLIRSYQQENPENHPREYCIADLGNRSVRVHIYRNGVYETSHIIEYGWENAPDQTPGDSEEESEQRLQEWYNTVAIGIRRAVNFYGFNSPESNLNDLYLSGSMARKEPLRQAITEAVNLRTHSVVELMPWEGEQRLAQECAAAVSAALEMSRR